MQFRRDRHRWAGPLALSLCVAVCALTNSGCASEYTVVTRSDIHTSAGARISAQNVAPMVTDDARIAEHLGLAIATYEAQLALLKERRNKVRARRRTYAQLALGTLAAAAGAAAVTAILASDANHSGDGLKAVGAASLGATFAGSTFALVGHQQEEPEAVDEKIRFLENDYQTMLTRLRALVEPGDGADGERASRKENARMRAGAIIEEFISHALAINVKG